MKLRIVFITLVVFFSFNLILFVNTTNALEITLTDGYGSANNVEVDSIKTIEDKIYFGITNNIDGAELWQYDGTEYSKLIVGGLGDTNNKYITDIIGYNNNVVVATLNSITGTQVWQYDGSIWTQINISGFNGTSANRFVDVFFEINSELYAATFNSSQGTEVWKYLSGTTWQSISTGGFGDVLNTGAWSGDMVNDRFYIGLNNRNGGELWSTADGANWTQEYAATSYENGLGDPNNTAIRAVVEYKGDLFLGTGNSNGFQVWKHDSVSPEQQLLDGFGDNNNKHIEEQAKQVFYDKLWLGAGSLSNTNKLLKYDIDNGWEYHDTSAILSADSENRAISALDQFQECMYGGLQNYTNGIKIFRMCIPQAKPDFGEIVLGLTPNNSIDIDIFANDTDLDNNINYDTFSITSLPTYGELEQVGNQVRYIADGIYTGTDSYTYAMCDTDDLCTDTIVEIVIGEQLVDTGANTHIAAIASGILFIMISLFSLYYQGLSLR